MNSYKPEGYNAVSPYLIVDGAQKMVDFMKEVFGAEQLRTYYRDENEDAIMHTEMKIDDSVIMLADSTEDWSSNKTMLHVYVPDVNKTFQKAIDFGSKVLEEPVLREQDPDKRGMFEDFAGNQWAVGTQI